MSPAHDEPAGLEIRTKSLEREAKSWSVVYGDRYFSQVRVVILDGEPALLMPWFETPSVDERKELLSAVRTCLTQDFVASGLKHSDVAWRNVMRCGKQVVMVDLDSVSTETNSDWVDTAIKQLEAKCL
jgi:hypothetical protein